MSTSGARVRWHARWVLPISAPPIADGTVITEGDRIVWVGPRAHAPAGGRDDDLGDAILTPGLVNAHSHLDMTMMRGMLDHLPFIDWIPAVIKTRTRYDQAATTEASKQGITEGLLAGITTYGDTGPTRATFDALRAMGVRGIAYHEVFGWDPAAAPQALADLKAKVTAMRAQETALVKVGVSPHAPYTVSDALFRLVSEYAENENLPVAIHIAEGADETRLIQQGEGVWAEWLRAQRVEVAPRGATALDVVRRSDLLRPKTLLIHAIHVSVDEAHAVAAAGCGVAHCPVSNAKLGHGIAPLLEYHAAGARVGLGTDSMASNDRMDILEEARMAALAQRARTTRYNAVTAAAALRLATLGGAEALRLDEVIGTLDTGKQADLAAFAVPSHGELRDPVAALVFGARPLVARRVVVAGVERVRDGVVQ